MKTFLLIASIVQTTFVYAQTQTSQECHALNEYVHSAASGWHLSPPTIFKPLSLVQSCAPSAIAPHASLCVHQASSLEAARSRASVWLRELRTCLNVRNTNDIRTITSGSAVQEVLTFDPHFHNGLPIELTLRLHHPTELHPASVSLQVIPRPLSSEGPSSWCAVVQELTNTDHIRQEWRSWQGPLLENSNDLRQYVCAKVPPGAASRFDCDLQITPQRLYWSARWTLPMNETSTVQARAMERAEHISSCTTGLQWQKGTRRHTWLHPQSRVKMELTANPNDSGRGPTLTWSVEHWKP